MNARVQPRAEQPVPTRRDAGRARTTSLLAALAVLVAACGGSSEAGPEPVPRLTAEPFHEAAPQLEPAIPPASPTPTPPPPSPSPTPSPTPTGPTEADKARFVAGYAPGDAHHLEHVAVDLDGDGTEELLFTFVREGRARIEVAAWHRQDGYRIVSSATAGAAQRIVRLRVGDVNHDGRIEIVTFERSETGSSLTVFAVVSVTELAGLRAVGGCHDGSATYGVVGAELRDVDGDGTPEIVATCDDSPLPVSAWSEDTYRWSDGAYRVVPEPPLPGEPVGNGADDEGGDDEDDGDGGGNNGNGRGRGGDG